MRHFFGYIRVSTVKQGEHGVSLPEQRDAILHYGSHSGLKVTEWFEERETAAKRGRPVFCRMLKLLQKGNADGVIMHKIDRGARNLRDWADLADLLDHGVEVHFANEALDLHSRGGRLSADIQAVVAADYIRNLREETRKGFYGRLKQGLCPMRAPLGYLDTGKGKVKEPDPARAPLVKKAFELYASARHNLDTLGDVLYDLGLRNRNGTRLSRNALSNILNNPFYIGIIRIKSTEEAFAGVHVPLVTKSLFDRVKQVLKGKCNARTQRHTFLFAKVLACKNCGRTLTGELQKGHAYYRCHTRDCPVRCIREEIVEEALLEKLSLLHFSEEETAYLAQRIPAMKDDWLKTREELAKGFALRLSQTQDRLFRLTDAYIERAIEKDIFEGRKSALLMERKDLEERIAELQQSESTFPDRLAEFFELAKSAYTSYKLALPEQKRELIKILTSNQTVEARNVDIELNSPFKEIADRSVVPDGSPSRDEVRTWSELLPKIFAHCRSSSPC